MATYLRFREKVGPQCAFCRAAATSMFKQEAVTRSDFLQRFKDQAWDNY